MMHLSKCTPYKEPISTGGPVPRYQHLGLTHTLLEDTVGGPQQYRSLWSRQAPCSPPVCTRGPALRTGATSRPCFTKGPTPVPGARPHQGAS